MRNTAAALTLLAALLASPVVASAQRSTADQAAVASGGDSEFGALHNLVISADGAWVAAEKRSDRGDGDVRVWSTEGDVSFTIDRGQNACISHDSRWVSALQKPRGDSGIARPTNKRAGQTLVLLDTQNGSRRTFDFVLSHHMTYSPAYLLYLQSPETKADDEEPSNDRATKPAAGLVAKERKPGTLHMVHLESDTVFTIENVTQYATHQAINHFAYVLHDEETGRDTLRVGTLGRVGGRVGWGVRAWHNGDKIEGLCWAGRASDDDEFMTLAFLDSTHTTGNDEKRHVNSELYIWQPAQSVNGKLTRLAQTLRNDSEFGALHNLVISADGAWVAAEERSDRGDGDVRVSSTQRDVTFTIERGQNPRISRDSRWLSALLKPPLGDSRTARTTNERAGQTLVLLDLQDGSRKTFKFVLSYDMTYSSTYLLYLQSPEMKADGEGPSKDEATKPATKKRNAGTLHQIPLNSARLARILRPYEPDKMFTKENVVEFATHPTNDHFAYVFHDEETGGETLHIVKWGVRAWYNGDKIEGLRWAGVSGGDESITLGFLDSRETTGNDGKRRVNSALYTWRPGQSPVEKFTRVDIPQ